MKFDEDAPAVRRSGPQGRVPRTVASCDPRGPHETHRNAMRFGAFCQAAAACNLASISSMTTWDAMTA